MKILYLNYIPSPYRRDFFNELARHCQLHVIYYNQEIAERPGWKYQSSEHHYVHRFLFQKEGKWEPKAYLKVLRLLKTESYDHIIVGGYARKVELFIIAFLSILQKPFILNTDGGFVNANPVKLLLKKPLIKAAKAYLAPGTIAAQTLQYYGAQPRQIFNYRFTSIFNKETLAKPYSQIEKQALKQQLGLSTNHKLAITIGRYIPLKGYELAIEAMHFLKRNDTHLVMLGEGESRSNYDALIRQLNLEDCVTLAGNQSKESVLAYCKAADVMILPTITSDVWGLVVNEAMSCALPVIASERVGAAHNMIEEGRSGHLVPVGDASSIAEAMDKILTNPAQYAAGALRIGKQYTVENMVKDHIACFKSLNTR